MTDIIGKKQEIMKEPSESAYKMIRGYVVEAQRQVYYAVNSAMVEAYWKIGKAIFE